MHATDDVDFRRTVSGGVGSAAAYFVKRHCPGAGRIRLGSKRAERATGNAEIGRIQVRVDVIPDNTVVLTPTHHVGQAAERMQGYIAFEQE